MKNANTVSAPVNQEAARQTLSPNASRGARSIARPRTASCVLGQRTLNGLSRVLLTALMGVCAALALAQEVIDHGGPIMQAPKVYPIFWLPPGFHFTATNSSGDDFTYEQLILRFFSDVSTGDYLNIVSQYPGECGPPALPVDTPCFGPVTLGPSSTANPFVEIRAYPHTGTAADPLSDYDITTVIRDFIQNHHLSPGLDMEFFVFLGWGVVDCNEMIFGNPCASKDFCAYHTAMLMPDGNRAVYAVMPSVQSLGGCSGSITRTPNEVEADQEIIAVSHELAESITNPIDLGWSSPIELVSVGDEIGDYCHFKPLQRDPADGSNATLNGNKYVVQSLWSNDDDACVLHSSSRLTTATVEFIFKTNTNSDAYLSWVAYTWQPPSVLVLPLLQWNGVSPYVRVFSWPYSLSGSVLSDIYINPHFLTSQWDLQSLELKLRHPNGTLFCDQLEDGSPLTTMANETPFRFKTPKCRGSEPVQCFVFDDGYTNMEGPSDAIYISGRTTDNTQGKACIPFLGHCHKWFGRCETVGTHARVNFKVFDDGYTNQTNAKDAILMLKEGYEACVLDPDPVLGCRKWFGMGATVERFVRGVGCTLFDDGYANPTFLSDAIYIPKPIPYDGMACMPGPGPGICRKWFGQCVAG